GLLEAYAGLVVSMAEREGSLSAGRGASAIETTARLLGAAEAHTAAIGARLEPVDRKSYLRTVNLVRELLGEEAFATAQTEGGAMTVEQAIQYALDETSMGRSPESLSYRAG